MWVFIAFFAFKYVEGVDTGLLNSALQRFSLPGVDAVLFSILFVLILLLVRREAAVKRAYNSIYFENIKYRNILENICQNSYPLVLGNQRF